jgi:predicted TIM-barrel fold metal-dependent hydrolase
VDLQAPDVQAQLEAQCKVRNVRGIRQIIGRHVDEDRHSGSGDLLTSPAFSLGLKSVASVGLTFDLQLIPQQYAGALRLLESVPELNVALCHCGSPWHQDRAGLAEWEVGIRRFAELPNLHCKVSGLGMFRPEWTVADARPLLDTVLAAFGTDRVMFGSNFPVDRLYGSYARVWDAYDELTAHLDEATQAQLFATNAERFYRI